MPPNIIEGLLRLALIILVPYGILAVYTLHSISEPYERCKELGANLSAARIQAIALVKELAGVAKSFLTTETELHKFLSQANDSEKPLGDRYSASLTTLVYVSRLATNYPKLSSDTHFLRLMESIQYQRSEVMRRLEELNASIRAYNALIGSFPYMLLWGIWQCRLPYEKNIEATQVLVTKVTA